MPDRHAIIVPCIIVAIVAFVAAPLGAQARQNLVTNGDFSSGTNDRGEPIGWHTKLTSIIPVPDDGAHRFRCGCGEFWPGNVRPWTQLRCPHCDHTNMGLGDSGDLYFESHENVELVREGRQHAIVLDPPRARVISHLIEVERGAGYEIRFSARAPSTQSMVWVEGFRIDDRPAVADASDWLESLPEASNPLGQQKPLRRSFRRQVRPRAPAQWEQFSEMLYAPRERFHFDYLLVSLYAYGGGGKAAFTDIALRKLSDRELERYQEENPARGVR